MNEGTEASRDNGLTPERSVSTDAFHVFARHLHDFYYI